MWSATEAEAWIHAYARADFDLVIVKSWHTAECMRERGILQSDLLYLLKYGNIYPEVQPSTRPGFYKYKICGQTPIPAPNKPAIKIVTAMWRDLR